MIRRFTRRGFIKTGLIYVPGAALAARAATTIIQGPGVKTGGAAAALPPSVINSNNGHGGQGNKQTRPMAGATIDWGNGITNGLVGCWLCNEGGGLTLYDIAMGRHATIGGSVTPEWAWSGSGFSVGWGAANQDNGWQLTTNFSTYAEVPSFSLGTNNVTAMVWFNADGSVGFANGAFVNKEPVNTQWLLAANQASSGELLFRGGGTGSTNQSTVTAPSLYYPQTHHLCGTINGTASVLYLDGLVISTGTVDAISDTTSALEFGRFISNWYFKGNLGPIYIWNRALTQPEVQALFEFPYQFINS